ncbi:MAG TPA: VWA-like domain-containing protein [Verrucomicrobiae bacterium]|nr:VWA-like domain-containing protein [Verrucomicrobiae bacterium]
MTLRLLENAVVRLLAKRPFYGHLLLATRRRTGGEQQAGITLSGGVPTITWDPQGFSALSHEQQEALLEHLLKHLLHLHMFRRGDRNSTDWDLAADLAVNGAPEGTSFGAVPAAFGLPAGLAAEEYYALISSPFDLGSLAGAGVGDASPDTLGREGGGRGLHGCDDHACWEETGGMPPALAEEVVRSMVREAERCSGGEVPAEIAPLVERLLRPQAIPWRQVLSQFVATASRVGRTATWKREHRRFSHSTPGMRKRRRLSLLVGVDVSESTDTAELREEFARELVRIAGGSDASLTVVYANSTIREVRSFRNSSVPCEVHRGGGFTDLRPVFEFARGMHPRPAAVIYLTDGIGPAPERMEFPTLWALTAAGEKPVPWGVELRLAV